MINLPRARDGEARRAPGALYGLAIGDALGMPTQLLSRPEIVARYGPLLTGFEPAPAGHPIAAGHPAGDVTDDTEQAVLLGRLLVAGQGRIDPGELAAALVAWEADMKARGSLDLLGPSTRRALAAVQAGTPPEEAGASGDTNGAAMRVTPIGIAVPLGPLAPLVDAVVQASFVTHGTSLALAGAAAVAAAVSAGISGATVPEATKAAVAAARLAAERGRWVAGADVAARIDWATQLVAGRPLDEAMDLIYRLVGTGLATQESVPAAFAALAAAPDDPWLTVRFAASLGGDCDTIAAMAGAVAGACHGLAAFPAEAVETIDRHQLDLPGLAAALLALRGAP
ncbi:MAG TPA: ADP-ribosylglycohydrolase family protein [Streptosporangiaceae bacterium]|jgi:ADP-ribosylglycohydrolase